jgi:hypothetical protein
MSKIHCIIVPPVWAGQWYRDNRAGVLYRTLDFLGFPGYCVGHDGRVWSRWVQRGRGAGRGPGVRGFLGRRWKRLKGGRNNGGYAHVLLYAGGRSRTLKVHHLVLLAFVGPCPPGMQCRHLDGRRTHNALGNLAWGTPQQQMADRDRHGTTARGDRHRSHTHPESVLRGEQNGRAKLTTERAWDIRRRYATGRYTKSELARLSGVSPSTIGRVIRGENWTDT